MSISRTRTRSITREPRLLHIPPTILMEMPGPRTTIAERLVPPNRQTAFPARCLELSRASGLSLTAWISKPTPSGIPMGRLAGQFQQAFDPSRRLGPKLHLVERHRQWSQSQLRSHSTGYVLL